MLSAMRKFSKILEILPSITPAYKYVQVRISVRYLPAVQRFRLAFSSAENIPGVIRFSVCKGSVYVMYQTQVTLFRNNISKHREKSWKNDAHRSFDELQDVLKWGQT